MMEITREKGGDRRRVRISCPDVVRNHNAPLKLGAAQSPCLKVWSDRRSRGEKPRRLRRHHCAKI